MTNLVILAVHIITNAAPAVDWDATSSNSLAMVTTQKICCIATVYELGTPEGEYLMTVQKLKSRCIAWDADFSNIISLGRHEQGIFIRGAK